MPTPEIVAGMLTKLFWSVIGSFLALLVNPPKGRREALMRTVVSVSAGFVAGFPLMEKLDLSKSPENVAFAFTLAAFIAWPLAGAIYRLSGAWKSK